MVVTIKTSALLMSDRFFWQSKVLTDYMRPKYDIPVTMQRILVYAGYAIIFLFSIAVFVPLNPVMPELGLDPSWRYAINEAVAQKLVFGRDLIFTFGPYASIYTKVYHPATDQFMLAGAACLAIGYGCILIMLMSGINFFWKLLWGVLMLCFMGSRDALFFSYVLLFNIYIYKCCSLNEATLLSTRKIILMGIISMPLGLLPLIKTSLALVVVPSIAIVCALLTYLRKYKVALCVLFLPFASLVFFWLWIGQPLNAIPQFVERSGYIISGYSSAMSYTTASKNVVMEQLLCFIISAGLILGFVVKKKNGWAPRLFLAISYTVFLFSAWKAGFVRHDNAHALIAGGALIIGALSLSFLEKSRWHPIVIIVAGFSGFFIGGNYLLNDVSSDAADGINLRMRQSNGLKESFDEKIKEIGRKANFPKLMGKSDIYSFQQAALIASGNQWFPHPVLQSYSSYDSSLAKIDNDYLISLNKPDNIFFRLETIDGRFPTMDFGPSLLSLIEAYIFVKPISNYDFLVFRKRQFVNKNTTIRFSASTTHKFMDVVNLPTSGNMQYVKMTFYPTLLGKFSNFFLNAPPVFISVALKDGSQKKFRVIPGMAESGFLVSPLIENNRDLIYLVTDKPVILNKEVSSISLSSADTGALYWKDFYTLNLAE